jgi:hypothetical protein
MLAVKIAITIPLPINLGARSFGSSMALIMFDTTPMKIAPTNAIEKICHQLI